MKLDQAREIAVVRLSALGDVCHTIAVVQAVQRRYPQARITWITGPLEAELVRLLSGVRVVEYDKRHGLKGLLALRSALSGCRFDVLLHMQWSLRASLVTRMLKARVRVGFSRRISREKQHWFVNHLAPDPVGMHVLDALMSIAYAIDAGEAQPSWSLSLPACSIELPERFVAINPSASKAERNWSQTGYLALIAHLVDRGVCVVLTGGPSLQEKQFAEALSKNDKVVNLVGKTSIAQMLTVIKAAQLLVSPDTGPAHMATIVGTPVVGLYAHSNPRRTGPYRDQDKVISVYDTLAEKEYGKPISELPWASRVHDQSAMHHIQSEQVIALVDSLL